MPVGVLVNIESGEVPLNWNTAKVIAPPLGRSPFSLLTANLNRLVKEEDGDGVAYALIIGGRTSFDLTPGRSLQSYEFELPVGGGLLAASGHLHDYGRELRIEEAATGRVVTRLKAELDPEGHMVAVEQRVYRRFFNLFDARIRLEAGVRYRVVGEYDNPTGMTIPDGGMAHIVGLFVPDDLTLWPKLDRSTDVY